jgi:hypothetical protein
MAISMAVGALLLIGIMTTSVLASKSTAVANSASRAANTAVSTQLRTNAFSVAPADVCPPKFVPPDPVVAGEDEVPEVGAVDKLEEDVTFDDLEAMEVDDIKAMVPETYEETDAQSQVPDIYPRWQAHHVGLCWKRLLRWTRQPGQALLGNIRQRHLCGIL